LARQICAWTDLLPESARDHADAILLAAAAGGADLADLEALVEQMRQKLAVPDTDDGDDGFWDRQVRLATTLGGVGKLDGDTDCGLCRRVPGHLRRPRQEAWKRARQTRRPDALS
jgi:hypothetical protein